MSTADNTTQSVPYGVGDVYVTLIRLADGTPVEPPQTLHLEGLQEAAWDDKGGLEPMHGEGKYALRMAGKKNELTFSFTVGEISGQMLNHLCFGGAVEQRLEKIDTGERIYTVPTTSADTIRIIQKKLVHLARIDSMTSLTIGGAAATSGTEPELPAGRYEYTAPGKFRFSATDAGKLAELTYDSNGTTLVASFRIPAKLTWNISLHTKHSRMTRGAGAGIAMKRKLWSNAAREAPEVGGYRPSRNGQLVFNPGQTGVMKATHVTDGVVVTTTITALPAAAYSAYVETGSAAPWVGDGSVELKANSGTAMTGVTEGEWLAQAVDAASVSSGKYFADAKGLYTFASSDNQDTVIVNYVADYQFVAVPLPEDGNYILDKGVRTLGGIGFTRVAMTYPLALERNQYAVDEGGTYYFDDTNSGEDLKISFKYEMPDTGQTIQAKNEKIGRAPTLMVDIQHEMDGETVLVSFERAKPMGMGVPVKQEGFAGMKFEMRGFVNRKTGLAYQVSTSA